MPYTVTLVPGDGTGPELTEVTRQALDDYLRISYATSMANIEKGLDRLEKFAGNLAA